MAPDEGSSEPAAQMSLLRQSQRWIVDDFSIHTTRLTLVSAKTGLPSLAVVSHLANQLSGTCKVDTTDFIASAELRRELDWLATLRIHPFKGTQTQFEHIEVSDDGCLVQVKLKEGMDQVRIQLTKDDERCRIAHVDLTQNGTSQPLTMRLAVFRRLTQTPKEGFNGLIQAAAFLTGEE